MRSGFGIKLSDGSCHPFPNTPDLGHFGRMAISEAILPEAEEKGYRIYKGHVIVDAEYDSFWDLWVNPKLNPFLFVVITEKLIKFSL